MTWLRVLVALCCLGLGTAAAQQPYPSRVVTIIVPAAPGGVTDALGRILAQRFTEAWGQQVIVENKPGANNQIAAEYVAKAPADGYTLFVGPETTFVVNPSLYPKLNYDPVKDFTPISGLVTINHALILHPSVPVRSVKELIELAKSKPGTLNYGTFGVGSSGHQHGDVANACGRQAAGCALQRRDTRPHRRHGRPYPLMFISVGSAVPQWRGAR